MLRFRQRFNLGRRRRKLGWPFCILGAEGAPSRRHALTPSLTTPSPISCSCYWARPENRQNTSGTLGILMLFQQGTPKHLLSRTRIPSRASWPDLLHLADQHRLLARQTLRRLVRKWRDPPLFTGMHPPAQCERMTCSLCMHACA